MGFGLPSFSWQPASCAPSIGLSSLFQVILKDLEVLAEIASSPAGQTEGQGLGDGPDAQSGQLELHIPAPAKSNQISSSGKCLDLGQLTGKDWAWVES